MGVFDVRTLNRIRVIENLCCFSESYAMLLNVFNGLLIVPFKSHIVFRSTISRVHGYARHLFAVTAFGWRQHAQGLRPFN